MASAPATFRSALRFLAPAGVATLLLACVPQADPPATAAAPSVDAAVTDGWETARSSLPKVESCIEINSALILPVREPLRSTAIERLQTVAAVELSLNEVTAYTRTGGIFTGVDTDARLLVDAAIAEREEQRRALFEERRGRWGRIDEDELSALYHLKSEKKLGDFRPYLVRAIAKFEGTGGFYVSLCDGSLYVAHGSLGRWVPKSVRLPIVVFLERLPDQVYATWMMAE